MLEDVAHEAADAERSDAMLRTIAEHGYSVDRFSDLVEHYADAGEDAVPFAVEALEYIGPESENDTLDGALSAFVGENQIKGGSSS
jgi:hypothetical protein